MLPRMDELLVEVLRERHYDYLGHERHVAHAAEVRGHIELRLRLPEKTEKGQPLLDAKPDLAFDLGHLQREGNRERGVVVAWPVNPNSGRHCEADARLEAHVRRADHVIEGVSVGRTGDGQPADVREERRAFVEAEVSHSEGVDEQRPLLSVKNHLQLALEVVVARRAGDVVAVDASAESAQPDAAFLLRAEVFVKSLGQSRRPRHIRLAHVLWEHRKINTCIERMSISGSGRRRDAALTVLR